METDRFAVSAYRTCYAPSAFKHTCGYSGFI